MKTHNEERLDHLIMTHTREKHMCIHCETAFSKKSNLERHIMTQTGEKPYQCSQCEKHFSQKRNLNQHIATHTGEKP